MIELEINVRRQALCAPLYCPHQISVTLREGKTEVDCEHTQTTEVIALDNTKGYEVTTVRRKTFATDDDALAALSQFGRDYALQLAAQEGDGLAVVAAQLAVNTLQATLMPVLDGQRRTLQAYLPFGLEVPKSVFTVRGSSYSQHEVLRLRHAPAGYASAAEVLLAGVGAVLMSPQTATHSWLLTPVTAESRHAERWSMLCSDTQLASALPAFHGLLSLTRATGRRAPSKQQRIRAKMDQLADQRAMA